LHQEDRAVVRRLPNLSPRASKRNHKGRAMLCPARFDADREYGTQGLATL
jgi:hypothetical protein